MNNISQSASPLKLLLHCWCLCDRSHHTAGPHRGASFTVLVGVLCLLHTLECQLISTCDHVMIRRRRRRKRTHLRLQTDTLLQHFKQLQVVFSSPIRERRPSVYSSAPGHLLFFFFVCLFFQRPALNSPVKECIWFILK